MESAVKQYGEGDCELTRASEAGCHLRLWKDAPPNISFRTGRTISDGARHLGRVLREIEYAADRFRLCVLCKHIGKSK